MKVDCSHSDFNERIWRIQDGGLGGGITSPISVSYTLFGMYHRLTAPWIRRWDEAGLLATSLLIYYGAFHTKQ